MSDKTFTHAQLKDAIWEELREANHTGENNDKVYEILGIIQGAVQRIKSIKNVGVAENIIDQINIIQLSDIDAPVFTHSQLFVNHFNYIKGKFLEILSNNTAVQSGKEKWDSQRMVGSVKERFKELEAKGWDWRSFYNGWLEGRADMFAQVKGIGKYKDSGKEEADFAE